MESENPSISANQDFPSVSNYPILDAQIILTTEVFQITLLKRKGKWHNVNALPVITKYLSCVIFVFDLEIMSIFEPYQSVVDTIEKKE